MTEVSDFDHIVPQEKPASPGELLLRARVAAGFTQEEVADRLNLTVSVIKFIEADEYKKLAGSAFIRGYLRAYAKVLIIDDKSIVQLYNEQYADDEQLQMSSLKRTKHMPLLTERSRLTWIATVIITLGVLSLMFLWWYSRGTLLLTPSPADSSFTASADNTPHDNSQPAESVDTPHDNSQPAEEKPIG